MNARAADVGRVALLAYLPISGGAIAAYMAFPGSLGGPAFLVSSVMALAALMAGPILHRSPSRLPWRWLALGMGAFVVGNALRLATRLGIAPDVSWLADIAYVGYVFLAIGLMCFIRVRRPRYRLARLIDGLAIGAAVVTLTSVPSLESALRIADANALMAGVMTLTLEALLVGGTAYMVIAGGGFRGGAQQLLFLGMVATAIADTLFQANATAPGIGNTIMNTLWLTSYMLIGLTALTPSMRRLTERQTEAPQRAAGRAMVALLGTIAVLTVANMSARLTGGGTLPAEVVEGALLLLVLVRAREVAQLETRHEREIALLLANAADALAVVGADGAIMLANPAAARMFGVADGSSIGRPVLDFLGQVEPDQREPLRQRFLHVLGTPESTDSALIRLPDTDGTHRSLDVTVANRLGDPGVRGVVLNFRDVTDRVQADDQVKRLGTAIEQAYDAVLITDLDGAIEYVNPAFERISGYSREEILGKNPRVLKSGQQTAAFYTAMWQTLTSGKPWRAEFVNARKDGTRYRMAGVITPLHDEGGRRTGYVGVSRDLTRQHELESEARTLSRQRALIAETLRATDPAGSPEAIGQTICAQVVQLEGIVTSALVVFEADGRAIPYGIAAADGRTMPRRRLPRKRVGQVVEQAARGPWIERWEPKPWHPYNDVLNDLGVQAIGYAPVRLNGEVAGYLLASSSDPNAELLLSNILPALVEFASISASILGVKIAERTLLGAARQRLTKVIERREFFPVYQPLCDAKSERIVGYEALTRFEDGVAPDVRFAEAYRAGVGEKLELAAIEAAIAGAAAIPPGMWLNINATPDVVMDGGGLQRLLSGCDRDLVLEVTEHSEITDYHAFRQALLELGPHVRLAVDDAGAGFASLRHILELRPAFVKLDRQVIMGIDDDEARQAMVAGLRHFAQNTGCWLIAEGVETAREMEALKALDVRYVQGYLLGRPVAGAELGGPPAVAHVAGGNDGGQLSAHRRRRR
jgi:PAS domain S-box-containing protein